MLPSSLGALKGHWRVISDQACQEIPEDLFLLLATSGYTMQKAACSAPKWPLDGAAEQPSFFFFSYCFTTVDRKEVEP